MRPSRFAVSAVASSTTARSRGAAARAMTHWPLPGARVFQTALTHRMAGTTTSRIHP